MKRPYECGHSPVFNMKRFSFSLLLLLLISLLISSCSTKGPTVLEKQEVDLKEDMLTNGEGPEKVAALAVIYYRQGKIDEMGELLEEKSAAFETNGMFQYALGNYYLNQMRTDEAKRAFEKGTSLVPHSAFSYVGIGRISELRGDFESAKSMYMNATSLNSSWGFGKPSPVAHIRLGNLYQKMGENDLAEEQFAKALSLNDEDERIYNGLGTVYLSKDPSRSKEYFERSIELNYKQPLAYWGLGKMYSSSNPKLAKEYFKKALKYSGNWHTDQSRGIRSELESLRA